MSFAESSEARASYRRHPCCFQQPVLERTGVKTGFHNIGESVERSAWHPTRNAGECIQAVHDDRTPLAKRSHHVCNGVLGTLQGRYARKLSRRVLRRSGS